MKLYDGRGKQFEKLIDLKVIKKDNRLKISEIIPKHARAKWYAIWLRWCFGYIFIAGFIPALLSVVLYFLTGWFILSGQWLDMLLGACFTGFFLACFITVFSHRGTWKSKAVAFRTLAQQGFCPNCGYIIRDTPAEPDGCTPCSECGYAWLVEPVDSYSLDDARS